MPDASGTCTTFIPGSGAYEFVNKEYTAYTDRIRNLSTDAAVDIAALESFTPDFTALNFDVSTAPIDAVSDPDIAITTAPTPTYTPPAQLFTGTPPAATFQASFDDGSGIQAVGDAPAPDYGTFTPRVIAAPNLVLPEGPGAAPAIPDRVEPDAPVITLPDEPTLLDIPTPDAAPELTFQSFDREVPAFQAPSESLQDIYFADHQRETDELVAFLQTNTVQQGVRDALNLMTQGGTGLPKEIEDALFERGAERAEESERRAVRAAEQDWAAKGFELPGSTVLATAIEARHQALVERGRLNRELTINFHNQEIDNLRFVVQQGLNYETQLMSIYLQLDANARELANGHFEVMRGIYNVFTALHELNIRAYTAEIQVFEANVRIELAKIDAYRTELEALRLQSEINQQEIQTYEASIRASLAQVQIFQAEIDAFNGLISADTSKIQAFRARVDAYATEISALTSEVDVYEAQVRGEESRTRAFATTVDAYRARVQGYEAQIGAEATKTRSVNDVVRAETDNYAAQVQAWATGVNADTQRIEAAVSQFRGQIEAYTAELSRDEVVARLQALGFDKELEKARTTVQNEISNIDRALAQLTTSSQLELQKLTDAARINAQLAAASMASLSLSANLSGSDNWSASSSTSCSTNYNASLSG